MVLSSVLDEAERQLILGEKRGIASRPLLTNVFEEKSWLEDQ
jgi:hypothetical protein